VLATASLYDIATRAIEAVEKFATEKIRCERGTNDQSFLSELSDDAGGALFLSPGVSMLATCSGCPASFQPKMPSAITLTFV
jgi:hypothetical protein